MTGTMAMATGLSMDLLKLAPKPKAASQPRAVTGASAEAKIGVSASAAQAIKAELAKRPTTNARSGFRVGVKAGAKPADSAATVNYDVTRRVKIQGEAGSDGRTAVGVGVEWEY